MASENPTSHTDRHSTAAAVPVVVAAPASPRHHATLSTTTAKKTLPPVVLKHAGSSSLSNGSFGSNNNNNNNNDELDLLFLPPGRIGTRAFSGGGNRSPIRSRSPSVLTTRCTSGAATTLDGSISSIEDYDSDILTDRAGIVPDDYLLLKQQLNNSFNNNNNNNIVGGGMGGGGPLSLSSSQLPIVLERMTDDSLEDNHAFSDITCTATTTSMSSTNSARVSVCSSSNYPGDALLLEPLEEGVDEEEGEGDGGDDEVAVTITNLENLNLLQNQIVEEGEEGNDEEEEDDDDDDDGPQDDNDDDNDDVASHLAVAKCSLQPQEQLGDDDDNENNDDAPVQCGKDNETPAVAPVAPAAAAAATTTSSGL